VDRGDGDVQSVLRRLLGQKGVVDELAAEPEDVVGQCEATGGLSIRSWPPRVTA